MSFFILEKIVFYVPSIYNLSIAIVSKGAKFLKWILTNFDVVVRLIVVGV